MCLQVKAHLELASSRGTEVRPSEKALAFASRDSSFAVTFNVRSALRDRANASIYSSDRRPDALRARGTHPALKKSSQVLPPLSRLLTACRIWRHWQGVGCKERSPSREASSQRQAPASNATYSSLPRGFAPSFETARAEFFLFVVWSQCARLRAVHGLVQALARKCTLP
jgi:hypothetical protein